MKKLLALLLALMLAPFSFAAAEESAAGTWYFVQLSYADYTTTATKSGLDMMLVLSENGDASSTTVSGLNKKETFGEWTQDGESLSITLDGEERTGVISGGNIILGNTLSGQNVLYFSRTAPLGVYYTPAEPYAASLADYNGSWVCRFASIGTRVILLSSIDSAAEITVTPIMANVYIRNTSESEFASTYPVSLQDSALVLGAANAPAYTLQMLTDGVVMCDTGSGVVYYFERTEASGLTR